jgi:CBS domain containing-hemolysin-like protein
MHLFHKKKADLSDEQEEMIKGVIELPETTVKEVMVPRTDTVFVASGVTRDELLEEITQSGHSRFPVYQETVDNITGILYVKDILNFMYRHEGEPLNVTTLIRKPFFVPLSKHINDLLREFRRRRVHIAVVVDEYGGTAGIVCMEDILEEIIGDIQDEFDNEQEDIVKLSEGVWLCEARVNLEDLAEKTGVKLKGEEFDTLGGFVFDLFGKIPVKYEKVNYQDQDGGSFDFIVQDIEGHKINSIKIVARDDDN